MLRWCGNRKTNILYSQHGMMVNTEDRLYSINIKNQIQYSITKLISFTYHWNCGLLCKLYHNKDGMLNWEVKLISRQVAVQNNSYQKHVM